MTVATAVHQATDYTQQAEVTNWPSRIVLVVAVLSLIALALLGMRRGWRNRKARQHWIDEPPAAPPDAARLSEPVEGLFLGTATAGDWMDRIVVSDLGVRSRAQVSWGQDGIWLERIGARDLFIPADGVVGIRLDRGVPGTVRAKDSVVMVTWRIGDAVLDTGFRADGSSGHRDVLDGLTSVFGAGVQGQEQGESGLG